jgi:hypothetical protein
VPIRLRSDNGKQFEAGLFQAALKCWIVVWGNSTPHYSQSNGHSEAAVKTVKELVLKLAPSGDLSSEEFLAGVRAGNGIVTGSNCIRPSAPVNGAARPSIFLLQSMERRHGRAGASGGSRCEHKIPLRSMIALAAIVTCCCTSMRPRSENEVMEPQRSIVAVGKYRSYREKFASGSVLWRNRQFLRLMVSTKIESGSSDTSTSLPVDVHNAKADVEVPGKEQPRIDAP